MNLNSRRPRTWIVPARTNARANPPSRSLRPTCRRTSSGSVRIRPENRLPMIPPRHHVVHRQGEPDPHLARHGLRTLPPARLSRSLLSSGIDPFARRLALFAPWGRCPCSDGILRRGCPRCRISRRRRLPERERQCHLPGLRRNGSRCTVERHSEFIAVPGIRPRPAAPTQKRRVTLARIPAGTNEHGHKTQSVSIKKSVMSVSSEPLSRTPYAAARARPARPTCW